MGGFFSSKKKLKLFLRINYLFLCDGNSLNVYIAIFYLFIYFIYIYELLDKSENKSPQRGIAKDWFASQSVMEYGFNMWNVYFEQDQVSMFWISYLTKISPTSTKMENVYKNVFMSSL